jgi:hypothetical protein
MLDQAVIRTGIRYGVLCALASFIVTLLLYFSNINPYGHNSMFSVLFIPIFIFWGSSYFKKYNDENVGFLKALRVALNITFFSALCSAMLLFVFATFAGVETIERHIAEMKAIMTEPQTKALTIKAVGIENYNLALKNLENTSPYDLAGDDFFKKTGIGFLVSIIAATFFRK